MELSTTDWVVFIVCIIIGVAVLTLFVASIVFCRRRLKDESNVRKRFVTSSNADIVAESPAEVRHAESIPPAPLNWQPMFIPRPRPLMMRPIQPAVAPLQHQSRDDDWIIVKKILRRGKKKHRSEGSELSSDSDFQNGRTKRNRNQRIMPTRYNAPRPETYDATVPADGLPAFSGGFYNIPQSGSSAQPGFRPFMMPRQ